MNKLKYSFFLIYLLLFSISAFVYGQPASIKISGNVIDEVTRAPIPMATVFVDGTLIGTTADSTGAFTIRVTDTHKSLVASHIGYYPAAVPISETSQNIIAMKVREQMLEEVVIRDERLRKQDLVKFKAWFLGTDEWGAKAVLLNDSVLWFTEDKEGFKATADGPLLVDLPELGYTVQTELVDFSIRYDRRYNSQVGTILGYFYFKPYPDGKKSANYEKNREDVYFNSSQHFLRALYNKSLDENGYKIYEYVTNPATRMSEIKPAELTGNIRYGKDEMQVVDATNRKFTIIYFFDDRHRPKRIREGKLGLYKQSELIFQDNPSTIRSTGTVPDYSVIFGGEMSRKKIGATLPENYEPQ